MAPSLTAVVYEHAAAFAGVTPWQASRDPALLVAAHLAAWEFYRHAPVTPGIDIYNLEAEAYGAVVEEPDGYGVPAIRLPLWQDIGDLERLVGVDLVGKGRLPLLLEACSRVRERLPGVSVRVPLAGPFSQAVSLIGFETLLCAIVDQPARVARALLILAGNLARLFPVLAGRGLVPTIFESGAAPPFISRDVFQFIEEPALAPLAAAYRDEYHDGLSLVIGGDTAPLLPSFLRLRPSFLICPAETDQELFLSGTRPETAVRVNMDVRALMASDAEAKSEARRVRALCLRHASRPVPPGAGTGVLPYDFPRTRFGMMRSIFAEDVLAGTPDG